jgi:hypothetical protein
MLKVEAAGSSQVGIQVQDTTEQVHLAVMLYACTVELLG